MNAHKAILIDPTTREITKIDLEDTPQAAQKALGTEHYMPLLAIWKNIFILADREIHHLCQGYPSFLIPHVSKNHTTRLFGKALVIACEEKTDKLEDIHLNTDEIKSIVSWI